MNRIAVGTGLIAVSVLVILLSTPILDDPRITALCFAGTLLLVGSVVLHAGLVTSRRQDDAPERKTVADEHAAG